METENFLDCDNSNSWMSESSSEDEEAVHVRNTSLTDYFEECNEFIKESSMETSIMISEGSKEVQDIIDLDFADGWQSYDKPPLIPYSVKHKKIKTKWFHKFITSKDSLKNIAFWKMESAFSVDFSVSRKNVFKLKFSFEEIGNTLPNFGLLSTTSSVSAETNFTESIKELRNNLIAVFSSNNANLMTGFSQPNANLYGEAIGVITFGAGANRVSIPSFQTATSLCGGLSALLFLFAKVVEVSTSEFIQSLALSFLLKITHASSTLYTEFIQKDFISLIGPVIRSARCIKGINLLNSILETACDKPLLTKRSDDFYVIPNTNANILHANLLISIIHRYSDWYVPKCNDSNILARLLETIQSLVRDKHPRQAENIQCLTKAGLISALLNFCKIHLIGVPEPVYLSSQAAECIVNLIGIFAGSPPNPLLLDDIIKVLLLLHKPSESFITHDRSKFYFLLSFLVMVKQKRISLPMTTKKLSLGIRRTRKSAMQTRNAKAQSPIQRSISLDNSVHNKEDESSLQEMPGTSKDACEASSPVYPPANRSMESIVNFSNDDRRLKLFLNPAEPSNALLNMKLKRRSLNKKRVNRKSRSVTSSRSRTTTDSETDREFKNKGSISESGIEEDMTNMVKEYEIIAIEDIRRMEETRTFKFYRRDPSFENMQHGIVQLQNGLFNLLRDFILILPDTSIQEVLTHYVTVDIILIMANHQDPGVRASIIKLLAIICSRLNETVYSSSSKLFHWYHLGNQIALHKADLNLVTNIVQWVTLSCLSIDQLVMENNVNVAEKAGMNSLIAILPQCIHDLSLVKTIFTFMNKLYTNETANQRRFMIEIGILPSALKSLAKFFSIWGMSNERILSSIQDLLTTIALQSLSSTGNISVVWDLLNGLTFLEDNKNLMIQRCIRSTQAAILTKLLESFFPTDKQPSSTKFRFNASDVNLAHCLLSLSEKKLRFELLINRIVQFITKMESSYIQTDQEVKLIESIVILSLNGCSHGNNIIGWGLCPSRPLALKMFIIKQVWRKSRFGILPTLACDGKIIKIMTHAFMLTDKDVLPPEDAEVLMNVCKSMGINASTTCNLSQTLEKMEFMRTSSIKDQNPSVERTIFKFEPIVQQCIDSAMKITRDVVELQNMERRILINEMRAYDESGLSQEWNIIINRMTHEGAPWCNEENYPMSWEMDHTEGPYRTRIRLKRCHMNIARKFLIPDMRLHGDDQPNRIAPLSYLRMSLVQRPHFSLSDQVIYTFPCKYLPVDNELDGEIVITESRIIFLANNLVKDPIIIDIADVSDIWLRRYQHQETGLEFSLETNHSTFFIFSDPKDRDVIQKYFADKIAQGTEPSKLAQQWREGQLTNWEYLMALNQISGRTFQDLMQYPVFPWILADYKSSSLDLTKAKTFRNLEKPIAVQHPENEAHYISNYNYLEQARMNSSGTGFNQLVPYHYGSHYSNSGTVLHFMVRVPPFTQFFLQYQDNNFDLPDRTFHSLNTTWRLASRESPTDVKELIPEFFCFPEMFENFEGLNFGIRQSGESVYDVILPPWANQSSRIFILIHRQALECDIVRQNLHKWIDLVFGYKQMGQEAIDAINVFHPATYIGFSSSNTTDQVERIALETMVRTYGQMPRQLLTTPHPASLPVNIAQSPSVNVSVNFPVKGLRWGTYTGSPELSEPKVCHFYQQFDQQISNLVALADTNVLYGLSRGSNIMQGNESDTINLVSWCGGDGIVRIRPLCDETTIPEPLLGDCNFDRISCCGTDPHSNQLWLGHKSGRISVYQCISKAHSKYNKSRVLNASTNTLSYNSAFRQISSKEIDTLSESRNISANKWKDVVILIKHTNEVMQICVSNEFKIVVSVAKDGVAAIWDLNRLQFVRSIEKPSICEAPIYLGCISPTLGDIVTIHIIDSEFSSSENLSTSNECMEVTENVDEDFVTVPIEMDGRSLMRLHTINAKYVNHVSIMDKVKCVCYSYIKEGTGINVIATGFDGGIVRLWSSWDLSLVKEINVGNMNVVSLCYSTYQHLVVLTSDNLIQIWESNDLPGNMPKFPQQIFHKR